MGQLIKLQDYISRYEQNIYLYPARFVRLKQQQWAKLNEGWERNQFEEWIEQQHPAAAEIIEEKPSIKDKVKGLLSRKQKANSGSILPSPEIVQLEKQDDSFDFQAVFTVKPHSSEDLKQQYLDQLFRFQMKWASSTLTEKSNIQRQYYYEEKLKYLLQRFPDTFLVLYDPIFKVKSAPIALETIVITPTEVWCVSFLEEEDLMVYTGSSEHFWAGKSQRQDKKVLNPLFALNRTAQVIKPIFRKHSIDLPVKQIVLSRNGYIDYPSVPYGYHIIDRKNYEEWFSKMRSMRSPLKNHQLKAARSLLIYGDIQAFRRHDWDAMEE